MGKNIYRLANIWVIFKNDQNCVPEPVAILGTVSDSLTTLDKRQVNFIPLTSFYFSEPRVTSNTVSDKISPLSKVCMSPPERTDLGLPLLTDSDKPISG